MKILLINPPCRESLPPSSLPLGLAYVASVLREAGHNVKIIDVDALKLSKEKVEEIIKKEEFGLVAAGAMVPGYKYIKWLTGVVKKHHATKPLIIGGALASSAPKIVMDNTKADAVVLGEAENTFCEVAEAIEKKKSFEGIDGLWFRKNGKIVKNKERELIKNLDELPFPAWDLFPIEKYLSVPNFNNNQSIRSINMISSRGCPFNCTFCYNVFGTRTHRARSIDNVIAEIKELNKRYGVKGILISDNLFVANKKYVAEFCERLKKEKIDIIWGTSGRVNTVNLETLKKMKEAGCIGLLYGFESGSQKMLDAMNKQVTVEQMKHAVRITKEAGIEIWSAFMVGIPGETKETIKETAEFIKEMDLFVPGLFIANPFPGSQLFDYAMKKGLIKDVEKFIEESGECFDLHINCSGMPDNELLKWRDWANREIISTYRRRHKFEALKMDVEKLQSTIRNFGVIGTAKKIIGRAKRKLKLTQ